MCSYIISVVYICHIVSCLKGFTLFDHIPHKNGMHISLQIYLKNREKRSMPITKIKHVKLFGNDSQKVAFYELK